MEIIPRLNSLNNVFYKIGMIQWEYLFPENNLKLVSLRQKFLQVSKKAVLNFQN